MSFVENLSKNNQFPIIFIGSGITKRFYKNAPSWNELLNQIWDESQQTESFYARLYEFKEESNGDDFQAYTNLARELEVKYNIEFLNGRIVLPNLTPQYSSQENISAFKQRIANIFSNLELKEEMEEELKAFRAMLTKARFIVTTNYDELIEKQLNYALSVRVGNKGLFENAGEYSELYKIHGSVKSPNSIVITNTDYEKLSRTSAIVNAKILSKLTDTPILFLGFSMRDPDVQSILSDLAINMPFNVEEASKRIGIIQHVPGEESIKESIGITEFGVHFTRIETDDYQKIYLEISKIDQGLSPQEVSKFSNAIRKLIEIKGQKGDLRHVLTTLVELDKLPDELKNRKLVVALGDERYIYRYPDYVSYIKSYFLNYDPIPFEIAIRFISQVSPQSTLPISKYVHENLNVDEKTKDKINKRLQKYSSLESLQATVKLPRSKEEEIISYATSTPLELLECENGLTTKVKLSYIILNIKKYPIEEIKKLVYYILQKKPDGFVKMTEARKLFMAYSLLTEPIRKSLITSNLM